MKPDPTSQCGPYMPLEITQSPAQSVYMQERREVISGQGRYNEFVSAENHDTIGMLAIDGFGNIAAGTSTNGARFKVPGLVGMGEEGRGGEGR